MKNARILALAGTIAGMLGTLTAAHAHQTYNVGTLNTTSQATATGWTYQVSAGYGNGVDGAINNSQGAGTINNSSLVWRSGVGAVSPEYNGNLPEMWYSGLHNTATGTTNRELGSVSSAGGTTFLNSANSLQARIATWNTATNVAQGIGLDPNSQIAVKGNSWLTGDGLDYGVSHVSCGDAVGCLADGNLNISWELKNLNPNSTSLLGIAIYGGWDTSATSDRTAAFDGTAAGGLNNPQGSSLGLGNLLYSATMSSASDVLSYTRLFDAAEAALYNGEYTIIIGALNDTGDGQYYLKNTSTAAPVPVPAALWLFGSALAGFGVIGRRRTNNV